MTSRRRPRPGNPGSAPTWDPPPPQGKKAWGPEGISAHVVELVISGNPDQARRVWHEHRDRLIREARKGMPTPGKKAGSANISLSCCACWAIIEPDQAEPWGLLEQYATWCLRGMASALRVAGLWSSEALSAIYGWILHLLAVALLYAPRGSSVAVALRLLLETHRWLLERLTVAGHDHRVVDHPLVEVLKDHDPVVWAPGERSPPGRNDGAILTSWLRWVSGLPDREKLRTGTFPSWPFRYTRIAPPEVAAVDHGARLRETLEVTRDGDDYSARLLATRNGNTEPTLAKSYVGGRLYVLDLYQPDRRATRGRTWREDGWIYGDAPGVEPVRIPAPALGAGVTWHLGPEGYGEGEAAA